MKLFADLLKIDHVETHDPAYDEVFEHLRLDRNVVLPSLHRDLLKQSNGIEAYAGYLRLFGVDTVKAVDAMQWNQYEFWKFAWGDRCREYWCFAETAWGDQYAYAVDAVKQVEDPEVYFLDAFSMRPKVVASSFVNFFHDEFLRSAKEPVDFMTVRAREKLGRMEISCHLNYAPSIVPGGQEDIDHVIKMDARAAMISNGDIALQVEAARDDAVILGLQHYEDQLHRARIRVIWS